MSLQPDEGIVEQVMQLGFDKDVVTEAVVATNNTGVEAAVNW